MCVRERATDRLGPPSQPEQPKAAGAVAWATRETDRVSKTLLVFTSNYQTMTFDHFSPKRQVEAGVSAPSRTPTPHGRTRGSLLDRLKNIEGHTPVHIYSSLGR